MRKYIGLLLLSAAFTSCKNTWSAEDKKAFYDACSESAKEGGSAPEKIKPYCDCVLDKIMAKYPNEEDAMEHMDDLAKDTSLINCKTERDK